MPIKYYSSLVLPTLCSRSHINWAWARRWAFPPTTTVPIKTRRRSKRIWISTPVTIRTGTRRCKFDGVWINGPVYWQRAIPLTSMPIKYYSSRVLPTLCSRSHINWAWARRWAFPPTTTVPMKTRRRSKRIWISTPVTIRTGTRRWKSGGVWINGPLFRLWGIPSPILIWHCRVLPAFVRRGAYSYSYSSSSSTVPTQNPIAK